MEKPCDNKMLLLQCIGNTCKLINVGKCQTAQPIQDVNTELPINYGTNQLPDLTWSGWLDIMADADEE